MEVFSHRGWGDVRCSTVVEAEGGGTHPPLCTTGHWAIYYKYVFLITRELGLDPQVGYHAVELLQRFMVKHLMDLSTAHSAATRSKGSKKSKNAFEKVQNKFPIIIFSCVQLASKVSLFSNVINNRMAVQFLHSVGHSVSTKILFETEMMILKGLEYRLNFPNPLIYVEILLEVLAHNKPSIPVEDLYDLCHHILQFVSLQRTPIFDTLLKATTQCVSPTTEQREEFVAVTEDNMLLGVTVITVATFVQCVNKLKQVVGELSLITGISKKSISDFAHVILMHILGSTFSGT
uniref:Cyclin N-terminal domain containing 1 n=1 Tax=Cynoglossus semilaevis TaxID=244447 RepID=A0A3P8VAR7_CYNSE